MQLDAVGYVYKCEGLNAVPSAVFGAETIRQRERNKFKMVYIYSWPTRNFVIATMPLHESNDTTHFHPE